MLYLTCTTITSVDLAHYGVSHAKDWVYVDCGTKTYSLLVRIKSIFFPCKSFFNQRSSIFNSFLFYLFHLIYVFTYLLIFLFLKIKRLVN